MPSHTQQVEEKSSVVSWEMSSPTSQIQFLCVALEKLIYLNSLLQACWGLDQCAVEYPGTCHFLSLFCCQRKHTLSLANYGGSGQHVGMGIPMHHYLNCFRQLSTDPTWKCTPAVKSLELAPIQVQIAGASWPLQKLSTNGLQAFSPQTYIQSAFIIYNHNICFNLLIPQCMYIHTCYIFIQHALIKHLHSVNHIFITTNKQRYRN